MVPIRSRTATDLSRRNLLIAGTAALASTAGSSSGARADGSDAVWSRTLLEDTPWETRCYVRSSGVPGPTVVVIGGVHGDEPAGVEAANAIRDRRIVRGTLLVIPRANEPALQTGARFVAANMHGDLARCFPRSSSDKPRGPLATTLWRMLVRLEPDWLLDLHEGWGVHRRNPATLGSTVLHGPHHLRQAQRMVEAVNATVPRKSDHFVPLQRFIPGSSVHAASQWLGVACLVQETTRVGRDLSTRVRQHVVMTERQLSDLGMVDGSCS